MFKSVKRAHLGWYFYDFGNSAYAAVVLLAIYSAYFKGSVVGGAEGSRLWGVSVGIAMLVVALTSPILGAIADYSASKKKFLLFYSIVTWTFTSLLFFVDHGDIFLGMLFFIIAEIGYRSGQVFYNSLLPEIAAPSEMGRVSGNGWAIGSAGGILCLLILLPFIVIIEGTMIIRLSLVFTAVFFALSSIPLFLWVNEQGKPRLLPTGENYFTLGVDRLLETIKSIRRYKEFGKFILSFLIYNDGILMALNFAAIIGAVLFGMEQQELIIFMIIVQIASVAGAYIFGILGTKIGFKRSLYFSLSLMIFTVIWMIFNKTVIGFYLIGAIAGFALTGVQSVSRTMVGLFAPEGRSAEFFGFFAVAGRTSSFIGPTIYGFIAAESAIFLQRSGVAELVAEQIGQRYAIGSIAVFLLIGMLLLIFVNEQKAKMDSQNIEVAK